MSPGSTSTNKGATNRPFAHTVAVSHTTQGRPAESLVKTATRALALSSDSSNILRIGSSPISMLVSEKKTSVSGK
jgi:hypothetical protein